MLCAIQGRLDVTNSFGVPFEEDKKDPNIWFLDHNYLENMYNMFRRVNAKERVLGFYSTGPGPSHAQRFSRSIFRSRAWGHRPAHGPSAPSDRISAAPFVDQRSS